MEKNQRTYKQVGDYFFDMEKGEIGSGAFGKVFKGFDSKNDDAVVAVKLIPATILAQYKEHIKLFLREINILSTIKGRYIVEFKKVLQTPSGNLYIVTSFCDQGSLEGLLSAKKYLPENQALKIVKEIAEAFVDIEQLKITNSAGSLMSIMHRDIKPANILFHQGESRLADFGFAKLVDDNTKGNKKDHTVLGSPYYMPPQILNNEQYSFKCDIWSMGIVFYEMLFGRRPWTGNSPYALFQQINETPLRFPSQTPSPVNDHTKDLIKRMLRISEDKRIDWKDILKHPALQILNKPISEDIAKDAIPETIPRKTSNAETKKNQTATSPKSREKAEEAAHSKRREETFPNRLREEVKTSSKHKEEDLTEPKVTDNDNKTDPKYAYENKKRTVRIISDN